MMACRIPVVNHIYYTAYASRHNVAFKKKLSANKLSNYKALIRWDRLRFRVDAA